jgi:hypothetical protein
VEQQGTKPSVLAWGAIGAASCFGGGIAAGLLGSVFTAGTWIWGAEPHPWLRSIGTVLLIVTIPLLIAAGHCLDLMEREQDQARRESHGQQKR